MEWVEVESSMVRAVGYDPATETLRLEYTSGSVYEYAEVPPEEHRALMEADSIGGYVNANIRDVYPDSLVGRAPRRRGRR